MYLAGALLQLVNLVFTVFELIILARVVISWLQVDPYNPIVRFVYNVTEPVLGPVRRRLPPSAFDFSPLIVLIAALVLNRIIIQLLLP